MSHFVKRALIGIAFAAASSGANAAEFFQIDGASGAFRSTDISCGPGITAPCDFTRSFTFDAPAEFSIAGIDISSIAGDDDPLTPSNLDFTSVTFNGADLNPLVTGRTEYRNLLGALLRPQGNEIVVTGTTAGLAAFAGTLSFTGSAIPEPATWALLIVGFGAIGASLRRRGRYGPVSVAQL